MLISQSEVVVYRDLCSSALSDSLIQFGRVWGSMACGCKVALVGARMKQADPPWMRKVLPTSVAWVSCLSAQVVRGAPSREGERVAGEEGE